MNSSSTWTSSSPSRTLEVLLANVGDDPNPLLEHDVDDVACKVPAGRKTVELLEDFAGGSSG